MTSENIFFKMQHFSELFFIPSSKVYFKKSNSKVIFIFPYLFRNTNYKSIFYISKDSFSLSKMWWCMKQLPSARSNGLTSLFSYVPPMGLQATFTLYTPLYFFHVTPCPLLLQMHHKPIISIIIGPFIQ